MSLELMQVRLNGALPVSALVELLNRSFSGLDAYYKELLDELLKPLRGYDGHYRPTTDDGYSWFWAAKFTTEEGTIHVLFPWRQDWDKLDGSPMDRSVAVYLEGAVYETDLRQVLNAITVRITTELWRQKRHKEVQPAESLRGEA